MEKKISVDEWIDIAASTIQTFCELLEDDGKISLRDGFTLILSLVKNIANAYKKN